MFKGLRTKIESEQKDQGSIRSVRAPQKSLNNNNPAPDLTSNSSQHGQSKADSFTISSSDQVPNSRVELGSGGERASNAAPSRTNDSTTEVQANLDHSAISNQQSYHQHQQQQGGGAELSQTVDQLQSEVHRLRNQLKSVIKERDDSNDQNGQLYQLIEKLRRNLEGEKEVNSNLESKLEEAEKRLAETGQSKNESNKRGSKLASSSKSIDPSLLMLDSSNLIGEHQLADAEELKKHVMELQSQINDKNRQLKIRQQNLNDIKRHLQMEIAEHAKTQEELTRVQNQLKQANQNPSANSESVAPQNGSSSCDIESNKSGSAINNTGAIVDSRQSSAHNDGFQESSRVSESAQLQYDNISCISRSSNSVDDNELHDYLHPNYNKDINNEYLKNVLFRYLTSTDTETAKHLIKALSVLMNFTPEQTAAIKSATNARSSWLRLK